MFGALIDAIVWPVNVVLGWLIPWIGWEGVAVLFWTWGVMALLVGVSWTVTKNLQTGPQVSRLQNALEIIVDGIRKQIRDISPEGGDIYLPFVGTLFLYIFFCNVLSVVPGFYPPTASLSTTSALALCVFVAVPFYGIRKRGLTTYLKNYIQPTPLMLPFNIIGEFSRTLALAVRLFGNMMSGTKIAAILLAVVPLFVPAIMNILGLLTGVIQAYIFAVLAMVYIASATQAQEVSYRDEQVSSSQRGAMNHG
ncbi:MAG: F0F1 ATP synthase subunit A [Gemmataceae bacterium]